MKCEWCGKGPQDGVSLYRINEKGVPGIWRCEADLDRRPDEDVAELVGIIEAANPGRKLTS